MNPLDQLIGLRPLESTSKSGYFINDLPGVGSELLENLTNKDAQELGAMWAQVKRAAWLRLLDATELKLSDVYGWKKELYRTPTVRTSRVPFVLPDQPVQSVGVLVELADTEGLACWLESLQVYLGDLGGGSVVVNVLDQASGQQLVLLGPDDQPVPFPVVELRPGLNTIELGGRLPLGGGQFYVCLVGTEADQDLALLSWGQWLLDNDSGVVSQAGAYQDTLALLDDTAYLDNYQTAPVLVKLRVECDLGEAIKPSIRDWTPTWQNLLGAEILKAKIYSPKTNYWSSSNLARADENRLDLEAQFKASLGRLVKRLDVGTLCASCSDNVGGVGYAEDLAA